MSTVEELQRQVDALQAQLAKATGTLRTSEIATWSVEELRARREELLTAQRQGRILDDSYATLPSADKLRAMKPSERNAAVKQMWDHPSSRVRRV